MIERKQWLDAINDAKGGDWEQLRTLMRLDHMPADIQRRVADVLPKKAGRPSTADKFGITSHQRRLATAVLNYRSRKSGGMADGENFRFAQSEAPDDITPARLRRAIAGGVQVVNAAITVISDSAEYFPESAKYSADLPTRSNGT